MRKKATIESGHEVPEKARVTSYGELISLTRTIRSLEVGQSFVVDREKGRIAALQAGIRLDIPLTSQRVESGDEVPRFRIWRKEKE